MLGTITEGSRVSFPQFSDVPPGTAPDPGDGEWQPPENWYGNIQYLINISVIGAVFCVFLFLVVKLRSDHRVLGPVGLFTKLLAVWHATGQQVARLCGANASQYLAVEGYAFLGFLAIALLAIIVVVPLNTYGGTVPLQDQFLRSTVIHLSKASPLLWCHYIFMVFVVGVMHLCINAIYRRLASTRFNGEISADCVAVFTLMIHGIPRSLSANKAPLKEYFEHRYPGKIFQVIVPPDLSTFYNMEKKLKNMRARLSTLLAQEQNRVFIDDEDDDIEEETECIPVDHRDCQLRSRRSRFTGLRQCWRTCKSIFKQVWVRFLDCLRCAEDDAIAKLQAKCAYLESKILPYRDQRARGAGIAFVIFKDIRTASRALQDINSSSGSNFSLIESDLARRRWKAERAPPAADVYWHHLGSSTVSRLIKRVAVNTFLLLLLFFCSSPLAALSAFHNVGHFINPEAMDQLNVWLSWVQGSSWAAAIVLQFLPNLLVFISMYLIIPAALARLSSYESHLTLSGEQRAALSKTVLFFLVNLIVLRGLLENSLEATLLHMRHCYEEGSDCKEIEQYMSSSFLANSCLSATAFLITSTFLGISFDLLSPIPWIKRKLQQMKRQRSQTFGSDDSVQYIAVTNESLHEELIPDSAAESLHVEGAEMSVGGSMGIDVESSEISNPSPTAGRQQYQGFDYVQYYAFNLTIFAMALIYSSFVPVIVPIAALYFGYRYIVDKYNFLFMYKVRGFASTNDGKLLGTVLRVMKVCILIYLFAMLYFFYVRGDREKLQFLCTLAILVLVCAKYGIEKLICPPRDGFDISVLESLGSIDNFVNGHVEYEILARPNFDWDSLTVS